MANAAAVIAIVATEAAASAVVTIVATEAAASATVVTVVTEFGRPIDPGQAFGRSAVQLVAAALNMLVMTLVFLER